jgi:hypothetical protein
VIVQLSDDAEIDLLVAIAFYEKHGTHVGDLFSVSISKDIGKNSGTVPGFFKISFPLPYPYSVREVA